MIVPFPPCNSYAINVLFLTLCLISNSFSFPVPPKVRVAPIPHVYPTGATVTLRCHADGIPEPKIIWEKNEREIPSGKDGKIYVRESKLKISRFHFLYVPLA
jgi:hypothetical protein